MFKVLSRRRLGLLRGAFAVEEGVAIGVVAKTPVVPIIGVCIILTAIRLRLEARFP